MSFYDGEEKPKVLMEFVCVCVGGGAVANFRHDHVICLGV